MLIFLYDFKSVFAVSVKNVLMFFQELVLTDLHAETTYSVTVAAYTTKGDGARSKPKLVTTTGAGRFRAVHASVPVNYVVFGRPLPAAITSECL